MLTICPPPQRWFLFSPNNAFYTTVPAVEFARMFAEDDADSGIFDELLECTQYAGDIMYVPTLWGHGTLNIKQSIGVAHEFSVESVCME